MQMYYIEEHAGPISWTWGGMHYTPYVTPYFIQFTLTYFKSTLRLFSFIMSVLPFYIVCQIKN